MENHIKKYFDFIQKIALAIGWKRENPWNENTGKEDLQKAILLLQEQCRLYLDFVLLWPLGTPL